MSSILTELEERAEELGCPKAKAERDTIWVSSWSVPGRPKVLAKEFDGKLYVTIGETVPWAPVVSVEEGVFFIRRILGLK